MPAIARHVERLRLHVRRVHNLPGQRIFANLCVCGLLFCLFGYALNRLRAVDGLRDADAALESVICWRMQGLGWTCAFFAQFNIFAWTLVHHRSFRICAIYKAATMQRRRTTCSLIFNNLHYLKSCCFTVVKGRACAQNADDVTPQPSLGGSGSATKGRNA